ncbi:MAG TPA: VIT1/CCC1 transporter family protein [Candidatus Paceibacterota bacterium]|nr:VIT1/CCC1 transporter family protein [Candidatus Paceibacterota bacterium]
MRNLVFGVEDGLVSTVGFISGIAASDIASPTLLLTGIVLIFSEAFSMAVGSFLSESSVQEYRTRRRSSVIPLVAGGTVMFLAYLGAGALVLAPYFFAFPSHAFPWSVGFSLAALFALGVVSARLSRVRPLQRGIRMLVVGGLAIGLGIFVARTVLASL